MQRGGVERAGPMGTTDSELGSDWLPTGEEGGIGRGAEPERQGGLETPTSCLIIYIKQIQ